MAETITEKETLPEETTVTGKEKLVKSLNNLLVAELAAKSFYLN